ncbi:MAG: phytanoyl-CoA dioxygenase family protein [Bythopirellula sp.]
MINPSYFQSGDLNLAEFARLCQQTTELGSYPSAEGIIDNVVVYSGKKLVHDAGASLNSELVHCLRQGPGVFVVRGAYADLSVIDRCTNVLTRIVAQETAAGQGHGDHFGSNQRVWNSLQKTCVAGPELFVDYYSNSILHTAAEAWLGPNYRITAQMNNIKPGGEAQSPHRDYHLGFQTSENVARFPLHAQVMSQFLTLQGAIAHGDMPVETGPTLLLPYSQLYPLGYLAGPQPEFADYFAQHSVQLPLEKGDALFFNPALLHAGGSNASNRDRIANLIQISSAFGQTMESIDHRTMIESVYPVLQRLSADARGSEQQIDRVIATVADGYSFPTNLDSDPPLAGNAPETQQGLVRRALAGSWTIGQLRDQLEHHRQRRQA